jgi:cytoskeletal protein CcmA (bactofilin family)
MFGKRPATSVGATTVVRGDLAAGDDDVAVQGRLEGDVRTTGSVTLAATGVVIGDIDADAVTVAGRVQGLVTARGRLYVLATGRIDGNVAYGTLEVERGGIIEGHTTATPPPVALIDITPSDEDGGRITKELFPTAADVVVTGDGVFPSDPPPDGPAPVRPSLNVAPQAESTAVIDPAAAVEPDEEHA